MRVPHILIHLEVVCDSVNISITCTRKNYVFVASRRGWRNTHDQNSHDYAFEMACSNVRYGPGVTQEVGMVKFDNIRHILKDPLLNRTW